MAGGTDVIPWTEQKTAQIIRPLPSGCSMPPSGSTRGDAGGGQRSSCRQPQRRPACLTPRQRPSNLLPTPLAHGERHHRDGTARGPAGGGRAVIRKAAATRPTASEAAGSAPGRPPGVAASGTQARGRASGRSTVSVAAVSGSGDGVAAGRHRWSARRQRDRGRGVSRATRRLCSPAPAQGQGRKTRHPGRGWACVGEVTRSVPGTGTAHCSSLTNCTCRVVFPSSAMISSTRSPRGI